MLGTVLIIDDEEKLRSLMKRIITLEGYNVLETGTLKAAQKLLEKEEIDVILCDVKLPDGSGVDFSRTIKEKYPSLEVILLTAYGNIPDGVQAIKNGAFDYLTKGDDNNRIIPLLNRAFEKVQLQKRIDKLEQQVGKKYSFDSILGSSRVIKEAIEQAKKVAPADTTVLLLGETGTGKEVFAQAIHNNSKRVGKPFVALNCSAFSRELLESELFGYKAGAFTNAVRDKKGLIEEANNGTIFLDEIGELPLDLQSKLLRVLETSEFIKIGDTKPTKVNVRIITATNRDLKEETVKGQFREDLYYRLNVFAIVLPPLRERKKDIPVLTEYFVGFFSAKINQKKLSVSDAFIEKLQLHEWKGNVRELKNVLERAVIMAGTEELTVAHLPFELQVNDKPVHTLSAFDLASVEKLHIIRVLHHTKNNKTEAAKLLNIGLATLYRKIEEYQIG
ncbi:DNA-binding transcriptional response regulator, NtrC family, contains REC, AAA-type ATPase, and a Fis-type DNA-binding domains [Chitinophaga sp. CF118]|uniref:sigma-54-dependent transcriptional regulator n=1 Tax=Chitinophaga sp. CF118 TaxID=1884367 RepID=UPI0008EBE6CD|nr:sigma-54 dependent transcriptional regulator [Chitinophaga sp. CF118]SFD45776.1 DNA-binding transcriptional response regulator, NtrC family, contains REC, AAA-type ATPase, and a Fis-type DNA-binding domains [Chitinophaga sp. CF118]